jgi:hypothetical protein
MRRNFQNALALALSLLLGVSPVIAAVNRGGNARASARTNVNQGAHVNRNTNVNQNANINRNANVNVNRNANVNVNRNVDVDVHGGYGYYGGGCCYHPVATAAAVTAATVATAAIVGSMVNTLPPSCTVTAVGGVTYQQCGNTWYQPQFSGGNTTYVVVNPPR